MTSVETRRKPTAAQRSFLLNCARGILDFEVRGDVVARCHAAGWVRHVPFMPHDLSDRGRIAFAWARHELTPAGVTALGDDAPKHVWSYSETRKAIEQRNAELALTPEARLADLRNRVAKLSEYWENAADGMRNLLPADVDENGVDNMEDAENDGMRMIYEEAAEKLRKLLRGEPMPELWEKE